MPGLYGVDTRALTKHIRDTVTSFTFSRNRVLLFVLRIPRRKGNGVVGQGGWLRRGGIKGGRREGRARQTVHRDSWRPRNRL